MNGVVVSLPSSWSRRRFDGLALLTALLLLPAQHAGAQSRQRLVRAPSNYSSRVDTTFTFDHSGSITVNAGSGNIVITGWSRDQVHVHAVSDDDNIRLDAGATRMTLETGGSRRNGDARFELSVPYGVRVLATARSGDISVRGTRGQVEVRSQNGDVQVEDVTARLDVNTLSGDLTATNVSGDVEVATVSGTVKLTDLRGNVDVGTVSGDIDLRGITSRLVRAKTTSGDVTFDGTIDPSGRYELGAHSGDIRLHIPRDASAQLTVSTWNGGVNSDFPITLKPGEHGIGLTTTKRLTFQIGGGAARITAESFSGDITISSNGRGASERR
jgi:DUF4097 and DUF4098 domain-containing protein YvlB